MNAPGDWLRANGIDIATTPELMHIAVAVGLAALTLLTGEFVGRRLGAMLAARWDLRPHARIDGLGPRGKGFHTLDEQIEVATLVPKAAALARVLAAGVGAR